MALQVQQEGLAEEKVTQKARLQKVRGHARLAPMSIGHCEQLATTSSASYPGQSCLFDSGRKLVSQSGRHGRWGNILMCKWNAMDLTHAA